MSLINLYKSTENPIQKNFKIPKKEIEEDT